MKKIIYAVLATLSGLVLVFSYRTSLEAVRADGDDRSGRIDQHDGSPAVDGRRRLRTTTTTPT